ncbi:hypothetical protein SNEBB_005615 [Seison nebaliae]|nr:hypothetical protein SNEBB_005615 [Seison nebaliae]
MDQLRGNGQTSITHTNCVQRKCAWDQFVEPRCYYEHGKTEVIDRYKLDIAQSSKHLLVEPLTDENDVYVFKSNETNVYWKKHIDEIVVYPSRYENTFRIKIENRKDSSRYHVPIQLYPEGKLQLSHKFDYLYQMFEDEDASGKTFRIQVKRKSNNKTLFDTKISGLIYTDQYIQIGTSLPEHSNVYGMGDEKMLAKSFFGTPGTLYETDSFETGIHPFVLVIDEDGESYGIFLWNSNAITYQYTPNSALIWNIIGGVLDFHIFTGPTPELVLEQYYRVIGRPMSVPYWSLGLHLLAVSNNEESFKANFRAIPPNLIYTTMLFDHFSDRQIPFDTDIDHWPTLNNTLDEVREKGIRIMIVAGLAIPTNESFKPFNEGKKEKLFIMDSKNEEILTDYVANLNDKMAFPNFFKEKTVEWWGGMIDDWRRKYGSLDGIYLISNNPSTNIDDLKFCDGNYNLPQFAPIIHGGELYKETLCMDAKLPVNDKLSYIHYDVHNIYGLQEIIATQKATKLFNKYDMLLLTESHFAGAGAYSGHFNELVSFRCDNLKGEIARVLNLNIFGVTYTGTELCESATTEKFIRWRQFAALLPITRMTVGESLDLKEEIMKAFDLKYQLQIYYYSLFQSQKIILKTLQFDYPEEKELTNDYVQFLIGDSLLASLATEENQREVDSYFPGEDPWYSYYDGKKIDNFHTILDTPLDQVHLHMKGGSIIMTQSLGTDKNSMKRKRSFQLKVALNTTFQAERQISLDHQILEYEQFQIMTTHILFDDNWLYYSITFKSENMTVDVPLTKVEIFGIDCQTDKQFYLITNNEEIVIKNICDKSKDTLTLILPEHNRFLEKDFMIRREHLHQATIDCLPEKNFIPESEWKSTCESRSCKFRTTPPLFEIQFETCSFSNETINYVVSNYKRDRSYANLVEITLQKIGSIYWRDPSETQIIQDITMDIISTNFGVKIKFSDKRHLNRPQAEHLLGLSHVQPVRQDYNLVVTTPKMKDQTFYLRIARSTGEILLDTLKFDAPLAFEDQYMHIGWRLSSKRCFGLTDLPIKDLFSEHVKTTFFTRKDKPDAIPMYICEEESGKVHGVLFLNGALEEFHVIPPQHFLYRAISGLIDFIIVPGPTLNDVIRQISEYLTVTSVANDYNYDVNVKHYDVKENYIGFTKYYANAELKKYFLKKAEFSAIFSTKKNFGELNAYIDYFKGFPINDTKTKLKTTDTLLFVDNLPYTSRPKSAPCDKESNFNNPPYPTIFYDNNEGLSKDTFCMELVHEFEHQKFYHYQIHNFYPLRLIQQWFSKGYGRLFSLAVVPAIGQYSGAIVNDDIFRRLILYSYMGIKSFAISEITENNRRFASLVSIPYEINKVAGYSHTLYSNHRRTVEQICSLTGNPIFSSLLFSYSKKSDEEHCILWNEGVIVCDTQYTYSLPQIGDDKWYDLNAKKMERNPENILKIGMSLNYYLKIGHAIFHYHNSQGKELYEAIVYFDKNNNAIGHFYYNSIIYEVTVSHDIQTWKELGHTVLEPADVYIKWSYVSHHDLI